MWLLKSCPSSRSVIYSSLAINSHSNDAEIPPRGRTIEQIPSDGAISSTPAVDSESEKGFQLPHLQPWPIDEFPLIHANFQHVQGY